MMFGGEFLTLVDRYKLNRKIKMIISSTDNEVAQNLNKSNISSLAKPVRKAELKKNNSLSI